MTLFFHQLRQGRISLLLWSCSVGALLALCVLLWPEMKGEMGAVGDVFARMGAFSAAFGMDVINFGTFLGFFSVECGNILGLGGALFAALLGVTALAGEEGDGTADFLLTHPVSRIRVLGEKLLALLAQLLLFQLIAFSCTLLAVLLIGEAPDLSILSLHFFACLLLQGEILLLCLCLSAFLHRGNAGVGLGLALLLYFLNLTANLTSSAKFLKYLTPFSLIEGADLLSGSLRWEYLLSGALLSLLALGLAAYRFTRKDLS